MSLLGASSVATSNSNAFNTPDSNRKKRKVSSTDEMQMLDNMLGRKFEGNIEMLKSKFKPNKGCLTFLLKSHRLGKVGRSVH